MQYHERLKAAREDKDITQAEVAEALNTTQAQIWKYESGNQKNDNTQIKRILPILSCKRRLYLRTTQRPRLA